MFTALLSNSQVRLRSLTNTQGLPLHRLTYIAFADPKQACPHTLNLAQWSIVMEKQDDLPFAAYVGIDWADKKHDFWVYPSFPTKIPIILG